MNIQGKPYEAMFTSLNAALDANSEGNISVDEALMVADYVRANFISLNAYCASFTVTMVKDERKVSVASLFPQLVES